MVPAPIKRLYIWDLTPSVSAVRYCLNQGFRVHLLEWTPPNPDGSAGLDAYVGRAIAACVATISKQANGAQPFLMGHSLGGTLATIYCALEPRSVKGLVLLGAPLCFEQASSRFRDALVALLPQQFSDTKVVAGSLLSLISAVASPNTFVWSRWVDAGLSLADHAAMDIHARIERWTLDEVMLPGKLVNQIVHWLYREDRFCHGILTVLSKPGEQTKPKPNKSLVQRVLKRLVEDKRVKKEGTVYTAFPHELDPLRKSRRCDLTAGQVTRCCGRQRRPRRFSRQYGSRVMISSVSG
jgi:polyhydroxyalkanoate synthase